MRKPKRLPSGCIVGSLSFHNFHWTFQRDSHGAFHFSHGTSHGIQTTPREFPWDVLSEFAWDPSNIAQNVPWESQWQGSCDPMGMGLRHVSWDLRGAFMGYPMGSQIYTYSNMHPIECNGVVGCMYHWTSNGKTIYD